MLLVLTSFLSLCLPQGGSQHATETPHDHRSFLSSAKTCASCVKYYSATVHMCGTKTESSCGVSDDFPTGSRVPMRHLIHGGLAGSDVDPSQVIPCDLSTFFEFESSCGVSSGLPLCRSLSLRADVAPSADLDNSLLRACAATRVVFSVWYLPVAEKKEQAPKRQGWKRNNEGPQDLRRCILVLHLFCLYFGVLPGRSLIGERSS